MLGRPAPLPFGFAGGVERCVEREDSRVNADLLMNRHEYVLGP